MASRGVAPRLSHFLAGGHLARFGESVACWPVTGDAAKPIVAVGASEGGNVEEGQVTVFGLTSPQAPKTYLRDQDWSIDYAFGYSVALVPDLDGDGLPDVVAGSPGSPIGPAGHPGVICILPSGGPLEDTKHTPWVSQGMPVSDSLRR